jgi:protein-S-isoprenylcysteine O-methyltransferase Ste14
MNGFKIFPLASFLILIILIYGRVVILKRKGVKVSSDSGKKTKTTVFLYPVFVLILLLWIWEMMKPAFQIAFSILPEKLTKPLFESVSIQIAGTFLTGFALVLLTLTLLHFKNSLRFGMEEENRGKLITTGVFSLSRNPFFLSLDLYFLGIAVLVPNLFFIGFAVFALVGIHFFILKEEKFMQYVYRKEYDNYTKKVRRYF